jgi:hypothetical protein
MARNIKRLRRRTAPLPTPISLANSGFVSSNTYSILKDIAERRDYMFGVMVYALGGNDVGALQPPFSALPQGSGFHLCQGELGGVNTEGFAIENVLFEHALPVLTGWNLNYSCHDEKVTILGLRPTVSVAERQTAPDLVPFSPSGNYRAAFCRVEQGRKLRVTVKNQGKDSAPASETTVTFGDKPFSLDTPAIPVSGSVDLLFDVPASCVSPFCSFKIKVDAKSQVDELRMEGNNSASGACIG